MGSRQAYPSDWLEWPHFYDPGLEGRRGETEIPLSRDLARHIRARRLRKGDGFVKNGRGWVARCALENPGGQKLSVREWLFLPPVKPRLLVWGSLPEKNRLPLLVAPLAELGVRAFIPVLFEHGQARKSPGERWQALAGAAISQCKSAWAPRLLPAVRWQTLAGHLESKQGREEWFVGQSPSGRDPSPEPASPGHPAPRISLLVGPEAGFSPGEGEVIASARRRGKIIALQIGPHILRQETATLALVAAVWARESGIQHGN